MLLYRKYQGVVHIGYKMLCDLVITFSGWDIPVQETGTHAFGIYVVVYIEFERNETFIVCLSCNEGLVPLLCDTHDPAVRNQEEKESGVYDREEFLELFR